MNTGNRYICTSVFSKYQVEREGGLWGNLKGLTDKPRNLCSVSMGEPSNCVLILSLKPSKSKLANA